MAPNLNKASLPSLSVTLATSSTCSSAPSGMEATVTAKPMPKTITTSDAPRCRIPSTSLPTWSTSKLTPTSSSCTFATRFTLILRVSSVIIPHSQPTLDTKPRRYRDISRFSQNMANCYWTSSLHGIRQIAFHQGPRGCLSSDR